MKILGTFLLLASLVVTTNVHAVGLGKMRILSALDQPLEAEIELLSTTAAELNTHEVGLASRSDFTRAGVEYKPVLQDIQFETLVRDNGEVYVRLTTDNPVTDPFLHVLVAFEWFGGRLIREYTALLDPPLYAQGRPASVSSPRIVGEAPRPAASGRVEQVTGGAPSPERPAPRPVADGQLYGPIARGETLSDIVSRLDLPPGVDEFQAMIAMLQRNPEAFIFGNINLVKEGSTVVLPTAQEMASISRVMASAEYTKHLNSWLAYRGRVAGAQLAGTTGARPTPLPRAQGETAPTPLAEAGQEAGAGVSSGLSEDVLRIIGAGEDSSAAAGTAAGGDSDEVGELRSQLAMMEESLLSTELENRELRERLAALEEQIRETNRLLRVQNAGLAMAEQEAASAGGEPAAAGSTPDSGESAEATTAADGSASQVRVTSSDSMFASLRNLAQGDLLWQLLLALAGIVLLIGLIVAVRRRRSYAEFEETMTTGGSYDLRTQSTAYSNVAPVDSTQHTRTSQRGDSQQSGGSLLQSSFMTEMGAPGMGTMQTDEVDPVAEAEVYMAYGRDQQAMEVLQEAIRRDPSRSELKIKLLEVYQKRKDVRAFESLAEELYPVIGKDPNRWSRVTEMGRRVAPRHPLFAAAPGGYSTAADSAMATGHARDAVDRDTGGLDLISAPFTRPEPPAPGRREAGADSGPLDLESAGANFELDETLPGRTADVRGDGGGSESEPIDLPYDIRVQGTPVSSADAPAELDRGTSEMDDFKASEIATKLDLARAYLEMGDKDAARGFIDEVLKEGNEAQRKQASDLAAGI